MLKKMWRKSTWLFSTYVSAFCREKSRLEKSRVPSLSFFCCLHQENPKKSAQFWKISLICPDPSSPNIMLEKKMTISFCQRIDINFEESFSTAAWFFNFPYQSRSTVDLLLKIVSVMIPDFFNFWVGHYHIIQQIIQCGTAWGLLRLFLNRPASKKYKLFHEVYGDWAGLPNRIPEARR